jgi:hypothetical protein
MFERSARTRGLQGVLVFVLALARSIGMCTNCSDVSFTFLSYHNMHVSPKVYESIAIGSKRPGTGSDSLWDNMKCLPCAEVQNKQRLGNHYATILQSLCNYSAIIVCMLHALP